MANRIDLTEDHAGWVKGLADDQTVSFTDDTLHLAATAPQGADQTVDPAPAPRIASASSAPRDGDTAGPGRPPRPRDNRGRFIGTSRIRQPRHDGDGDLLALLQVDSDVAVEAALQRAVIDYEFEQLKGDHRRRFEHARVLASAIVFGVEAERAEVAAGVYAGRLVQLISNSGGVVAS